MPMPSFLPPLHQNAFGGRALSRHAVGDFYSAPPDSLAGFVELGKGMIMIGRGMDREKGWGDRKGRRGGKGMRQREGRRRRRRRHRKKTGAGDSLFARLNNTLLCLL